MPETTSSRTIFVDRDGTIIEDTIFSTDPAKLAALPGVVKGLARLQQAGCKLVIITNQSGVARGKFTEGELQDFHRHLEAWFAEHGVRFAGIYYCPHYPEGEAGEYVAICNCRKPAPGMLLKATEELNLDLSASWMIGDRPADIEAGRAAGCRTIRVVTGEPPAPDDPAPEFTASDFSAAVEHILQS